MIVNLYGNCAVASSDKHRVYRGQSVAKAIEQNPDNRTQATCQAAETLNPAELIAECDTLSEAIKTARSGGAPVAHTSPPAPETIVDEIDTDLEEN